MSRDGSVQTTASAATDFDIHSKSSRDVASCGSVFTNEAGGGESFEVRFVPIRDANFETTSVWVIMT